MKEKIIEVVGDKLNDLDIWIDEVYSSKEGSINYLHIVLDSKEIMPLSKVVQATRIISPLLDKIDIMDDKYMLDIYAKSKGDDNYE